MTMPAHKRLDSHHAGLRGWAIVLLTVLAATFLIAAISEWSQRPPPSTAAEETGN